MAYICLEVFGGAEMVTVVTDEDGKPMLFNTRDEAQDFSDTELQVGLVVDLDADSEEVA